MKNNDINLSKLAELNFAFAHGILDLNRVHEMCMTSKREQVKELHPYAITSPHGARGRWRTNFVDASGCRKTIRAQSENELLDKLIPLYFNDENIDKKTFHNLFDEWLLYKSQITSSPNTILRHKQHYNRYYLKSPLNDMPIGKLTEIQLEMECNKIVKDFALSNKEWVNIKTILNGMFNYAKRMKYISDNPVENLNIGVKFRQVVKKTSKTQTYNTDEIAEITQYLDDKYKETGDVSFMAIRLNFYMGLRVGELVTLKWSDIQDRQIHIVREEIRDQNTYEVSVVEHTKTHTDRYVYLVPAALEILKLIPREGEYIFKRDGLRLTSRQINYVLEKYAERHGKRTKSSHKLRKTYASLCSANGVPIDFIREQLGHASLSTTYGYIYNPLTEQQSYEVLAQALGGGT